MREAVTIQQWVASGKNRGDEVSARGIDQRKGVGVEEKGNERWRGNEGIEAVERGLTVNGRQRW